jgi:hypothetical protein
MAEGTKKLEDDTKEGRAYSSGIRMQEENEVGEKSQDQARKQEQ